MIGAVTVGGSGRPVADQPDGGRDEQSGQAEQVAALDPLEWPESAAWLVAHPVLVAVLGDAGPAELVDLPTAVEDAIDLIAPAAAARQIRIDTALQNAQVSGDRVLLRTAGQQPHRQRRQAQRNRRLGTGQHQNRRRHRRTHRRQWRRAHPRRPGNRAVRAVPPPRRPDRQPPGRAAWPFHRGIGRPCAWWPRPGPRRVGRRTGRADHAACHGKRPPVCSSGGARDGRLTRNPCSSPASAKR